MNKNKYIHDEMINVLHVINSLNVGGAEQLLVDTINAWKDQEYNPIVAFLIGEPHLQNYLSSSIKVFDLSNNGRFSFFCLFKLMRIIIKEHVSIIHLHDPQSGLIARFASLFLRRRFIITTRHNPELKGNYPLIYRVENLCLKYSHRIIAISNAVKEHVCTQYNVPNDIVVVIHNGIDLKSFVPTATNKLTNSTGIRIGSVGRLHPQKGHDILIKAFNAIIPYFPNAKLLIAGTGGEEYFLRSLTASLGIEQHVSFLGMINRIQLIDFLNSIDIFVLASRYEGFGIAIVEAMAMEKPVIASATGGIVEIIHNNINGLLFEPENVNLLAEQMRLLIGNPILREQLGKQARQNAVENFSIESYTEHVCQVYRSLIEKF
jgi:glycosyltransferase involved in cell wall biosynthesis